MRKTFYSSIFIVGLLCGLVLIQELTLASTSSLPAGFATTRIVTGLNFPTDMVVLPSGDFLVTEKGTGNETNGSASIRLVKNGQIAAEPVITLAVNAVYDSGLLAIQLDPNFATNGYFYVWYATAQGAKNWSGESRMRLSRLTFNSVTGKASPASEVIVLDNVAWGPLHHGNSLLFDGQGNLLIGQGDRTVANHAQDFSRWEYGKIIRIRIKSDGSYEVPADNPFLDIPQIPDVIYSFGVRNPYRMARRAADGKMVLGDVGEGAWEEINLVRPAQNYGWPIREGPCPRGQLTNCPPAGSGYTDPIITYQHDPEKEANESGAVTGLAFYDGTTFPTPYQGKLFFADFNENFIAYADVDQPAGFTIFSDQAAHVTDIEYWHETLYTLHIVSGEINQIYYQGGSNQIPTAAMAVDPPAAVPNTPVNFSAAGSQDPDDINLTYHWDFGDGVQTTTTTETVVHTYTADGTYTATLEVRDPRGGRSALASRVVTIYSGEFPTIGLAIEGVPGRSIWHGGDTINFSALRSTTLGLDPSLPYRWQIDLHHNDHVHPIVTDLVVNNGTFDVPAENHDHDWNLSYRFRLIMRTNTGQEVEVIRDMFPNVVNLTVQQSHGQGVVVINNVFRTTPHTYKAIANISQTLIPSEYAVANRSVYGFSHWRAFLTLGDQETTEQIADPAANPYVFAAPAENTTLVAEYTYLRPAEAFWLPVVRR